MKLDIHKIIAGLALGLLTFIAGKVWQGVEIAQENKVYRMMQAEDIQEMKGDVKGLRSDLDQLWGATNDLAQE